MTWNSNPFASPQRAAQTYARVGVETGVGSADPHRLVLMLYEGVLRCLAEGRGHMQRGDIPAKARLLSRALQILEEGLIASLDEKAGGELARQLKDLYAYLGRRIVLANSRNDPALLDEVVRLLGELNEAWSAIAPGAKPAQGQAPAQPQSQPLPLPLPKKQAGR